MCCVYCSCSDHSAEVAIVSTPTKHRFAAVFCVCCYCHNRNTLQVTSHLHLHATTSIYCVYGRLSLCWFYYYYFYTWYTGLLALVCVFVCVQHLQILVLLKYSILFYTSIIKFASFCLVILRIDYSCTYNL